MKLGVCRAFKCTFFYGPSDIIVTRVCNWSSSAVYNEVIVVAIVREGELVHHWLSLSGSDCKIGGVLVVVSLCGHLRAHCIYTQYGWLTS